MLSRKNGLLFVAGGLASIAIVSLLEAAEDEHYDIDNLEADNTDAAFQKLVDEVRKEWMSAVMMMTVKRYTVRSEKLCKGSRQNYKALEKKSLKNSARR